MPRLINLFGLSARAKNEKWKAEGTEVLPKTQSNDDRQTKSSKSEVGYPNLAKPPPPSLLA